MKPQKQAFLHKPEIQQYGDCMRTCMAVMFDLDRDDVPHFLSEGLESDRFKQRIDEWLEMMGYHEVNLVFTQTLESVLDWMKNLNPNVYYLLAGQSKNKVNHVVVACNDKIVCDTSIDNSGIVGPTTEGYYWLTFFVEKRFIKPKGEAL